jgi:drug/metabolite transporter (DMT)-like permease
MFLYGFLEVLCFDLIGALLVTDGLSWAIQGVQDAPLSAWLRLAYVVAISTVAAYGLNSWALRFASMSLVAVYIYVQPLVTAILAYLMLGERLHPEEIIAALLIIIGVRIVAKENAKRANENAKRAGA